MANMSRTSFNKYCGRDVKTYIEEHETSAQQRRIAEIMPTSDNKTNVLADLSLDQFTTYAEHEFNNCGDDIVQLKDLFYRIKNDARLTYEQVIKLREIYEAQLNNIGKSKTVTDEQFEESADVQSNADIIKHYKQLHQCHIPVCKSCDEWSKIRLFEHIAYHLYRHRHGCSHKQAIGYVSNLDIDQRCRYVDSEISL